MHPIRLAFVSSLAVAANTVIAIAASAQPGATTPVITPPVADIVNVETVLHGVTWVDPYR
ncbi:MAG: hypothetical protein ABIN96_03660 [Rubrivivax sp.]